MKAIVEPKKGKSSYNNVALDLTLLTTLAGALLYVSGFLRLFYFMNHFQASMFILDIPVEVYLVHGLFVFFYAWWLTIPLFLISILLSSPWGVFAGTRVSSLRAFTLLVSVVALFLAIGYGFVALLPYALWFTIPLFLISILLALLWSVSAGARVSSLLRALTLLVSVFTLVVAMMIMAEPSANDDYESQKSNNFSQYHPRVKVWLKSTNEEAVADLGVLLSQGCYRLLLQTQKMLYLFAHPSCMKLEPWLVTIPLDEVIALQELPLHESPQCTCFPEFPKGLGGS